MRLSFLAIGSELLSGHVLESNSNWIQKKLNGSELEVISTLCVVDEKEKICEGLDFLKKSSDIILICGGLGPTDDDITREVVSEYCDEKLVFDDAAWEQVQKAFKRRQRTAPVSNKKQAMRSQSAEVLENEKGTAPGFKMINEGTELYSFPGVPVEFKHLAEKYLLPRFSVEYSPDQFKLYGIGESDLMDKVHTIGFIPENFEWGTIASIDGITIKFPVASRKHADYETVLQGFEDALGEFIYTKSQLTPIELLCSFLKDNKKTIATAESCTGGLFAAKITEIPGSSSFINGSVVAYQNEVKMNTLKVESETLEKHGAVSEECAIQMALGALDKLNSNIAVSITGIAGPTGGTPEKPVGTVCMAIVDDTGKQTSKTFKFNGGRNEIRERSCTAIALLTYQFFSV